MVTRRCYTQMDRAVGWNGGVGGRRRGPGSGGPAPAGAGSGAALSITALVTDDGSKAGSQARRNEHRKSGRSHMPSTERSETELARIVSRRCRDVSVPRTRTERSDRVAGLAERSANVAEWREGRWAQHLPTPALTLTECVATQQGNASWPDTLGRPTRRRRRPQEHQPSPASLQRLRVPQWRAGRNEGAGNGWESGHRVRQSRRRVAAGATACGSALAPVNALPSAADQRSPAPRRPRALIASHNRTGCQS